MVAVGHIALLSKKRATSVKVMYNFRYMKKETDLLQKSKQIVKIFSLLCFSKSSEIRKLGNIFEKDRKSSLEIMKVFTRFKEELGREKLVEQSFPNFVSWEFFPTFLFLCSTLL